MTDSEILEFTQDFRKGILDGKPSDFMCLAVCAPLESLLTMYGVDVKLIYGYTFKGEYEIDHVWLELSDGRILDPTADQFDKNYPMVYLGEKPDAWIVENVFLNLFR